LKTYLESHEIELLEQGAANIRDKLLIRILFRLGCRISEALSLTTQDIDFQQGRVTILHLKTRLRLACPNCGAGLGRGHAFCPKCGAKVDKAVANSKEHRRVRTLPLDGATMGLLREYIERGGPVFREGAHLIFGINRHRAWQVIRDCAERTGLGQLVNPETGRVRGVSPHRLRDSFAVHAMKLNDTGDGLRLLQEHLGHTSFDTTAKYRKIAGEEHRVWYEKLWGEGGGRGGGEAGSRVGQGGVEAGSHDGHGGVDAGSHDGHGGVDAGSPRGHDGNEGGQY